MHAQLPSCKAQQHSQACVHLCQVASSEWFDVSPLVNTSRAITPADARVWVQIYAQLLALTHQSIARNLAGTLQILCHALGWHSLQLQQSLT